MSMAMRVDNKGGAFTMNAVTAVPQRRQGRPRVPASRDTLQARVRERLTDMILDGEIVPGKLITIRNLAASFEVSTMPVREALKSLVAANALAVVFGRSVGVPRLSVERLNDLRSVRGIVEGTAAAWAAERAKDQDFVLLEQELERLNEAVAAGDVKGYLQGNRAFHFGIYRAAGSPALFGTIESLWLQISPYFNLLSATENYRSSNIRHASMLDALQARNSERSRQVVLDDIEAGYIQLLEYVTKFELLTGNDALTPAALDRSLR
jgi:DNA-binding GntR family transcriptional regulator